MVSLLENPTPLNELFFTILPPPGKAMEISELAGRKKQALRLEGRLRPPEIFHISLLSLGAYSTPPEDVVATATEACDRACAVMPPIELQFDQTMSFPPSGAFVLTGSREGNSALKRFHQLLAAELRASGFEIPKRASFNPHVTMLYSPTVAAKEMIDPIGWKADEIVLVLSHYGETRYDKLGRWKLRGTELPPGPPTQGAFDF